MFQAKKRLLQQRYIKAGGVGNISLFSGLFLHSPFTIFKEYRMRFGIVKLENFVFVCLCTHLSLYLYPRYELR